MFYLKKIFDELAFGQFSGLAVGNSPNGSISEEQYPKIISIMNSALLDIYTRLPLRKKEFDLYQRAGRETYYIRPDNVGDPNVGDPNIYIDGTEDKEIDGDIIKPIKAYNADGTEVFINKNQYPDDIFMPQYDVITIKERTPLEVISIVYQASYPEIVMSSDFDPAEYELNFPRFITPALLANMASRIFIGKTSNAGEGQPSMSNTFTYKYETEMARINQLNLVLETENEDTQFDNGGWT